MNLRLAELDLDRHSSVLEKFFCCGLSWESRKGLCMCRHKERINARDARNYLAGHEGGRHFGYFDGDVLVAWAVAWPGPWKRANLLELGLAVADEWQGRGVGPSLWSGVIGHLRARNPRAWFRVRVVPGNERMERMCRGLGFRVAAYRRGRLDLELNMDKAELFEVVRPYTMIKGERLGWLWGLTRRVVENEVHGAIVQCGVWKGGTGAMMAHLAPGREVWLFDSFASKEEIASQVVAEDDERLVSKRWPAPAVPEDVKEIVHELVYDESHVHLVEGWFEDTLWGAEVGSIALLHIDCDWYEPVQFVLNRFYNDVSIGGYVVIDDWGWNPGVPVAVADYFSSCALEMPQIVREGKEGAHWQKQGLWIGECVTELDKLTNMCYT